MLSTRLHPPLLLELLKSENYPYLHIVELSVNGSGKWSGLAAAGGANEHDKLFIGNIQVEILDGYDILAVDLFYIG